MKKLFLTFSAVILVTGCNDFSIEEWTKETRTLRAEVESLPGVSKLSSEEYALTKQYFSRISDLALQLTENPKQAERLDSNLRQKNLDEVCGDLFLREESWKLLMKKCTTGRFFVCSEELRVYPDLIKSIRMKLSPSLQETFNNSNSCPRNF